MLKTPQLIARLSRAVASGPVGPVFTGPHHFSVSMRCTHGASLAEPRLLGKAWLREATRRVLIAPRRGAHFQKCLRNYLRRPEIKKISWGGMPPDPPSWRAYARIKYITRSSTPKLNILSTALDTQSHCILPLSLIHKHHSLSL